MKAVQESAKAQGVVMVQIYLAEGASAASDFANMLGLTFAQVPDPDGSISALYQARSVPVHFFIGKDGTIKEVHQGVLAKSQMEAKITELAAG